mmetsp:Transcript_18094/g.27958  ORF Transcript_18094/g.27958 Transcript_18094/m.27958 type:complete len:225 (+) Transcript_18094:5718-6392(+)
MPRACQVCRHWRAHVPQPDESDFHARSFQFQSHFTQWHQHLTDGHDRHVLVCELPFRSAILVDDRGPDPFEEIAMFHRACREAVFEVQRLFQTDRRPAQAVQCLNRAGHGQRTVAPHAFQRVAGKVAVLSPERCENVAQTCTMEVPVDIGLCSFNGAGRGRLIPLRQKAVGHARLDQAGFDGLPVFFRDEVISKTGKDRITRIHPRRRGAQILTQTPWCEREHQ